MIFLQLFWEFFKIGLFSIGGGLATLPFLEELMNTSGWYTVDDLTNLIAISECTPGPLGVNMSTYVGNIVAGPLGGVIATLGLMTPSIIIIILIAIFLQNFSKLPVVQHVFGGLRPASTALIAVACVTVAKVALLDLDTFFATGSILDLFKIKAIILAAIMLFGIRKFKKHPFIYIVISAAVGIIFKF